jgi:hypothetical protein
MPRNNSRSRRAERRERAEIRQVHWDGLTKNEKLEQLAARGEKASAEYALLASK